jgi:hypothetical protein
VPSKRSLRKSLSTFVLSGSPSCIIDEDLRLDRHVNWRQLRELLADLSSIDSVVTTPE